MSECSSVKNTDLTYYQKGNKQEINTRTCLKKKKIKKESKQEMNIKTYLKKNKIKKESMEEIDITRCLKKKMQE